MTLKVVRLDGRLYSLSNRRLYALREYKRILQRHNPSAGKHVLVLVQEVPLHSENPFSLEFSPDGHFLVVGAYTGENDGFMVSSELVIIDTNENSPTYLNVLSRLQNQ